MEKILNQEEIDALFRAVRGGTPLRRTSGPKRQQTGPCSFRREGQINRDQVRSIGTLHETFARNLGHSLGAYLRVVFDVNLVSVEQLQYAEFLQRVPETIYMASINLQPLGGIGAIQIDLALAFPLIDLLLGGQGKTESHIRDMTEIEEEILESVVRVICREVQTSWQPLLSLEFVFDQRQPRTEIQRLIAPDERILALSFEVRVAEVQGTLNLIFSGAVSSALLQKVSQHWSHRQQRNPAGGGARLRERLLTCPFPVELRLERVRVSGRDLVELEPGSVLTLRQRIAEPAVLTVAQQETFSAFPVRKLNQRAAQLGRRLETRSLSDKGES